MAMATPVKMPELGESITEGTITRWLKQEGDRVEVDEPLFEISTDKVDTEVPSPVAGVLKSIKVQVDETVEVGAELAEIEQDGEGGEQAPAEGGEAKAEEGEEAQAEEGGEAQEAEGEPEAEAGEGEGREREAAEAAEAEEGSEEAGGERQREATAEAEGGEAEAGEAEQEKAPAAGASGDGETTTVTMPELGESITEGTITRWLKQEGDRVEVDEPLFEISTDKVDTEVPSPVAGVLQSIKVQVDETVEVGAELAVIGTGGGKGAKQDTAPRAEAKVAEQPQAEEAPAEAEQEQAPPKEKEREARPAARAREEAPPRARPAAGDGKAAVVSPLVRRLAREHDIDLAQVEGTGSGGRVRREDVEAYLAGRGKEPAARERPARPAAAAAAPAEAGPRVAVPLAQGLREEVVPATRLRRLIAERMVASLQTSAQLTSAVEVDMTNVMRLRERAKDAFKQREGVSLSPLPFCIVALIAAVREYPNVNSAMDEDGNLHVYKDVHLGVAVDTPKGLFVPVIKNAESLNLAGLAKAIADVAARTRDNKIRPDELSGSTITVTNTGSRGVLWDTPIINQPNAAIFATPAILKRPVVVDDPELGEVVAVRHVMQAVLTYDHRIVDGADAARFLVKIKEVLEQADFEGDLGMARE
jgi:pyruvate dehydrogenase E2 component (dihydrolipoyllysine-residue acetyltransferase)